MRPITEVGCPKQRKAASRKERRKRKRQAVAQARECASKNGAICQTPEEEEADDEDINIPEEKSQQLHEEWLERERLAQEEFRLWSEREEAARKRKEDEELMIKKEWETQQMKEQEEKEQKQQEKRDRERKSHASPLSSHNEDEAVQKMLDEAENQLDNGGMWMNPEAPVTESSENYGTERDVANCPFFLKTGACRFGDRCSRKHVYPTASPTLMIRGMFITFGMEESRRDDYEMDAWLEHSEEDLQETFIEFYHDALPEFKSVGKVVQFKVSCNYEPHLRGNVYVQFDTEEQCKEAFIKFNGRWYAGKQLHCEICPVTRWKNAICGLFDRQKCPKGKNCNFLHVFRNPGNEFWEADRDLHMSPDRSARGSHRDGWHSERYVERGWRQRHCSRSPPRSERSHSRREDGRWRSRSRERSRERRSSHQQREDRWSFRSTHNDRGRERCRSRSRDRSRSRSRERELDRQRNRSKDKERKSKNRNKSEERDSKDRNTNTREDIRDSSRHTSRDGERNKKSRRRSKNRSPEKPEENPLSPNDETHKSRRHKHSKKKKKSKKKHKKKSHLPEGTISSGDSENEKESEEETVGKQSDTSQSQETNVTELQNNFDASGDREKMCEAKSEEFNTEVPNKLAGNDDITS